MLSSPNIRAFETLGSNAFNPYLKTWWNVAAFIKELPKEVFGSPDFL